MRDDLRFHSCPYNSPYTALTQPLHCPYSPYKSPKASAQRRPPPSDARDGSFEAEQTQGPGWMVMCTNAFLLASAGLLGRAPVSSTAQSFAEPLQRGDSDTTVCTLAGQCLMYLKWCLPLALHHPHEVQLIMHPVRGHGVPHVHLTKKKCRW